MMTPGGPGSRVSKGSDKHMTEVDAQWAAQVTHQPDSGPCVVWCLVCILTE